MRSKVGENSLQDAKLAAQTETAASEKSRDIRAKQDLLNKSQNNRAQLILELVNFQHFWIFYLVQLFHTLFSH